MPEVEVNGTRLYYQQSGDGPDVVLVHAVTSNQAVWVFSGLVEALAEKYRVTAYDLRGHGMSARPATGYTSAVMAEDFRHLHAALGLKPAYLIGHSFGGVVSMHAAALTPACVAGVLLSDSFFPGLKHIEPNFGRMNIWVDLRETFATVGVELGDTVDFTRLFRETAALPAEKMKALEDIYGAFGRGWLRQLPKLAETTCGDEVLSEAGLTADVLASTAQPVVALYDEFSPFLATCRWLEQHLPRCTAEIIPAAKHLAMLDNTAGFTDAVKQHLKRSAPRLMYFASFILKNLTRRPIRTVLTILGLSVAVGSMIALLGLSRNFRSSLADTFAERRVDLVVVRKGATIQLSSEIPYSIVEKVRKWDEVEAIDAALVDMTEMQIREPRDAEDIPPSHTVLVQGWLPENFGFGDMEILEGRALTKDDTGHRRAMLGYSLARDLNKHVGDTITILKQRFEIIGVFKSSSFHENSGVLTILKDYQDVANRKGVVTGFSLRVRKTTNNPAAEVEAVRQRILALTEEDGRPLDLAPDDPSKYLDNAGHLKITDAMAWMVSSIAILIGIISMLNTMAMSVMERTQEIGILRAVGWPRWRIIRMVLGEAVLLALAAAVFGSLGAIVGTHLMALSPKVSGFIQPGIPFTVVVMGTVITLLIGLLGGAYPAFRAAQLLPTEAIRHD